MANQPAAETLNAEQLQAILRAPVPRIYANGLGTAISPADFGVIFLVNNMPAAIVNMSWTTAKTLHTDIGKAIEQFEAASSQKIQDIGTVNDAMQKYQEAIK